MTLCNCKEMRQKNRLIRALHFQDMLANVRQHEVVRYGRNLVQVRLAELSFDVVLLGEREASVCLHARLGRLPRGLQEKSKHCLDVFIAYCTSQQDFQGDNSTLTEGLNAAVCVTLLVRKGPNMNLALCFRARQN